MMETETLELIEAAIAVVKAVRNHYEETHRDYRYPETTGPNPLDMVTHSNEYLKPLLRARNGLVVDAEEVEIPEGG